MTHDSFIYRVSPKGYELMKSGLTAYEAAEAAKGLNDEYYNSLSEYEKGRTGKRGRMIQYAVGDVTDAEDYYMAEKLGLKTIDADDLTFEDRVKYDLAKFSNLDEEPDIENDVDDERVSLSFRIGDVNYTARGEIRGRSYHNSEYVGNAGVCHYDGFVCSGFTMNSLKAELDADGKDREAMDIDRWSHTFELVESALSDFAEDEFTFENWS